MTAYQKNIYVTPDRLEAWNQAAESVGNRGMSALIADLIEDYNSNPFSEIRDKRRIDTDVPAAPAGYELGVMVDNKSHDPATLMRRLQSAIGDEPAKVILQDDLAFVYLPQVGKS